ncbi:MAG TPA: endonuclease/exonuclease/phosphatase family protein [Polyangiaceae bacterium]
MKRWLSRATVVLAVAYPAALVVTALLFRLVGEGWWVTSAGMYLPRHVFLAPLLPLTVLILVLRRRKLLLAMLAAALIGLVPLMGLVLPWPRFSDAGDVRLRVLSLNVNSGAYGPERAVAEIVRLAPDIALLQEASWSTDRLVTLLRAAYPEVQASTEFIIASRYPIRVTKHPDRLGYYGDRRSPRFMQYVVETPLGSIALYNVHPLSPRESLRALRGEGLRREIRTGRLFSGQHADKIQANTGLRVLQVSTFTELATRETLPLIIAGDMNLPTLSPLLTHLSPYQDGFQKAGAGFGYTFPAKYPFMRLDRIYASDELEFVSFDVGCQGVSDHLCVIADLQRRR